MQSEKQVKEIEERVEVEWMPEWWRKVISSLIEDRRELQKDLNEMRDMRDAFKVACDLRIDEVERLEVGLGDLRDAARAVMGAFDEGLFVRDTSRDAESDYILRMIRCMQVLADLNGALRTNRDNDACVHSINPVTDRCVLCGRNRFNREAEREVIDAQASNSPDRSSKTVAELEAELAALREQLPVVTKSYDLTSAPPNCPTHNEPMILQFWERPGGPPGNGWMCQSCKAVREQLAEAQKQSATPSRSKE